MYSLLKEIDKYIKENKIKITQMDFGYECLPDYINQAILYAVREMDEENNFSLGLETFFLNYDHQGKLYIQTVTDNKKHKLLIFPNEYDADIVPGVKILSERKILEYAYLLEQNRLKQLEIRDFLSIKYPHKSRLERLKLEYAIMHKYINKIIIESYENGKDILESVDIEKWLHESYEKITSVIEEENNIYLRSESDGEELLYNSRSDNGSKKTPLGGTAAERVNAIIPSNIREEVLRKHRPIFKVNASPTNNEDLGYFCYLYRIGKKVYMLILEPKSGINHTKLIGVYDKWFDSEKEFRILAQEYLEMTPKETLEAENIVRTNHTTLEVFEDSIGYAITGESRGLVNPHAKKRIKEMRQYPNKRG